MGSQRITTDQTTTAIMYSTTSIVTVATLLVNVGAAPGHGHYKKAAPAPTKTIAELAIATPQLSTLLAAVKAAGLLADKEALTAVLLRHVVPGAALKARDVPHGTTPVKTAGGEEIEVTRNRYISIKSSAGKAGVIAFDILASNGVVHLVNSVF